jgi:hypothetical protein
MPNKRREAGSGADTGVQAGQGGDEMDEKNKKIAHRRLVAGPGIPRNHARINNSPATGSFNALSVYKLNRLRAPPKPTR